MVKSLLNSIRKAAGDYSLRRFIVYAANPFNWLNLIELKRQAKIEKQRFSEQMAKWQDAPGDQISEHRNLFHPWMRVERGRPQELTCAFIPPDIESADPEILMRHDRLGWVLQMAAQDESSAWQAVEKWLEERWKNELSCKGSYTISERLSNLILLWNIAEPTPSLGEALARMMRMDAVHLLAHPEYHGENGTNNHILNNARALILTGAFLGNKAFYEAGCWLLENQLTRHVLSDGVVREASTHYQWVITRWVMEVGCAFHLMDQQRFKKLRPLLEKMLDACVAMQLGTGANIYLPLLGDISPDFPPAFYKGMTDFGYALVGYEETGETATAVSGGFWPQFFIGRSKAVIGNWLAADKSWARLANVKWSLLAHSDTHPDENRVTHGHHDLFSFELAYDGIPVMVDSGRKNYLAGRDQEEAGILDEWHNTILVNGNRTGFVPRGYMPVSWLSRMRTCPQVTLENTSLDIRLDTPREVPGASRIQRVFKLVGENKLTVTNRITLDGIQHARIKLVMYVMGEINLANEGLELERAGRKFTLFWSGLDTPVLHATSRYIEYSMSEPCTRIEWDSVIAQKEWVSVFEILAEERGA